VGIQVASQGVVASQVVVASQGVVVATLHKKMI
jgi:hypothetical protein